ncbi:Uncharacterised protein [Mycobacteroides abscessus subsp. abscessus]|nr:Uncharacterised protein [Mycobacteroides abscessus subsp. abscessus]
MYSSEVIRSLEADHRAVTAERTIASAGAPILLPSNEFTSVSLASFSLASTGSERCLRSTSSEISSSATAAMSSARALSADESSEAAVSRNVLTWAARDSRLAACIPE